MKALLWAVALVAFTAVGGCDVFIPEAGFFGQKCRSDGRCAKGLICAQGQCVDREMPILFVRVHEGSIEDGLTWETAYKDPQSAVNAALEGDTIVVAAGRYRLEESPAASLVEMRAGVDLLGGFSGDEDPSGFDAVQDLREVRQGTTRSVLDCEGGCAHVVVGASNALIDGFEMRGGAAGEAVAESGDCGGGLLARGLENLVIENCQIRENSGVTGGGACIEVANGEITFENCEIRQNEAIGSGGGLLMRDCAEKVRIQGCTVSGNSTSGDGGGIACKGSEEVEIIDSSLESNSASEGGGGYSYACNYRIERTFVEQNFATDNGGGVCYYLSSGYVRSSVFWANGSKVGGGAYLKDSAVVFVNDIFSLNSAQISGGGLYLVGDSGASTITNSILWLDGNDGQGGDEIAGDACLESVRVEDTCIQGGFPAGSRIITDDPMLVNSQAGELALTAGSNCIDAGQDGPGIPECDVLGLNRVGVPDLGAYEYGATNACK